MKNKTWHITPKVSEDVPNEQVLIISRPSVRKFSLDNEPKNSITDDMTDPDRTGVIDLSTGKFHSLNDLNKNGGIV